MTNVLVGFKKLAPGAIIPTKAHATDSGFDLYASQRVVIVPEEVAIVKTDIAVVLPPGYDATIRPRSGVTAKTKLRVQLGTIDNAYRGELGIIVENGYGLWFDDEGEIAVEKQITTVQEVTLDTVRDVYPVGSYVIEPGDKIAQLVVHPIPEAYAFEITGDLDDTDRGEGGFGSTGTHAA